VPRNCTGITLLDTGKEMFAPATSMAAPSNITSRPVPGCAAKLSADCPGTADAVMDTLPEVAVISLPPSSDTCCPTSVTCDFGCAVLSTAVLVLARSSVTSVWLSAPKLSVPAWFAFNVAATAPCCALALPPSCANK
jgi:hypothetical protein